MAKSAGGKAQGPSGNVGRISLPLIPFSFLEGNFILGQGIIYFPSLNPESQGFGAL